MAPTAAAAASMAGQAPSWSDRLKGAAQALRKSVRVIAPGVKVKWVLILFGRVDHGKVEAIAGGAGDRGGRPGINMAHHAGTAVIDQHAGQAARGAFAAVGDDHHAGVLRIAHADPPAVLSIAFNKGQSETASVPSRMASVSRLGLATEPVSRWSRPITIGAFSSPDLTISLNARPAMWRSPRPSQQMRAGRPWKAMRSRAMSSQRCTCACCGNSSLILASVL